VTQRILLPVIGQKTDLKDSRTQKWGRRASADAKMTTACLLDIFEPTLNQAETDPTRKMAHFGTLLLR
jgi:hypothetical protein